MGRTASKGYRFVMLALAVATGGSREDPIRSSLPNDSTTYVPRTDRTGHAEHLSSSRVLMLIKNSEPMWADWHSAHRPYVSSHMGRKYDRQSPPHRLKPCS